MLLIPLPLLLLLLLLLPPQPPPLILRRISTNVQTQLARPAAPAAGAAGAHTPTHKMHHVDCRLQQQQQHLLATQSAVLLTRVGVHEPRSIPA